MVRNFTIKELIVKVVPGGFLLSIIYFTFEGSLNLALATGLDFLYTFVFLCASYVTGELLHTLAHELDWMVNIFFKFRRPSKVFLYRNNPVIKNEYNRKEIFEKLNLKKEEVKIFEKDYGDLSSFWWKKKKSEDDLSQGIFWRLYRQVSGEGGIRAKNRNYLFSRLMMVEFLLISIAFLIDRNYLVASACIILYMIFLWRSRSMAEGLVFKTVLFNLKEE